MTEVLAIIGLSVLSLFIFIGIPFIAGIIVNFTDNDDEGTFIKTSIVINMILVIVLSVIIFKFIDNPEKFGYQKIQTEQTTEVNEYGKN